MTDPRVYAAANPAVERRTVATFPNGAGNGALWFSVFAPPAAWSVDALTSIAVHQDYCVALVGRTFRTWSGVGVILTVVGIVMLLIAVAGGVTAWRASAALGHDTGLGDTDIDRRRFMARAGLVTCALFSFGIILRIIAVFIVPPSFCG
ncbi:MAG: hypothetical protein ACR2MQ_06105 [Gemmatimonadaceae bacterium]